MTRADQILLTKVCLDELPAGYEGLTITNDDPNPVTYYIDKILDHAAFEMLKSLPLHLCPISDMAVTGATVITKNGKYVGQFDLPADYVKIAYLKYTSWTYEATEEISESSPEYKKQLNPYICGGAIKPILVKKAYRGTGSTNAGTMEAYTVTSTDTIQTKKYVARLAVGESGKIEAFWTSLTGYGYLNKFLAWYAAAQVAQILQNDKAAQYCMGMYASLLKSNQL